MSKSNLQLRSLIAAGGELQLSLRQAQIPEPAVDEVVIRVLVSPINPSDLGLLLGPGDISMAKAGGTADNPINSRCWSVFQVSATVPVLP